MTHSLSDQECRLIGVLMEKSVTTPEQYPLTVNALTTGCNQKSNRNPVTAFSEETVRNLIATLEKKRLITLSSGFGSRVDKISHRFCNTEFSDLKFSERQFAVVTELLLRGPQTQGELRGRCQRLADFDSVADVEKTMQDLLSWEPYPLIAPLPREAGKRETRYTHCFSTGSHASLTEPEEERPAPPPAQADAQTELDALKATVMALEKRIEALEARQS
ncbi:YceH family protein [Alteromonas halophila]|uniref:UPF0502 protein n=1 Tax=Alteromonas halophila TaxID=516698 RepID=A0A918JMC6_9ALTE|nr:DUF480 domain-containing protein [Alteromonas halophila]GGW89810.1 UPF0502 protein [Alteromonas halophila]